MQTTRRSSPGAALTEYLWIVLILVLLTLSLVGFFGFELYRWTIRTKQSLDTGTPQPKPIRDTPDSHLDIGGPDPSPPVGPTPQMALGTAGADPFALGGGSARVPPSTRATGGEDVNHPTGWRPENLLGDMTQEDDVDTTLYEDGRCFCASSLAARVLAGEDAVDRLLADLAWSALNGTIRNLAGTPPAVDCIPRDEFLRRLDRLRDKLANQSLTFRDLAEMQDLLYRAYGDIEKNTGGESVGILKLRQLGNPRDAQGKPLKTAWTGNNVFTQAGATDVVTAMNRLQPGESMLLAISGSGGPPRHAILVGRDSAGRQYLYDPAAHTTIDPTGRLVPQMVYQDRDAATVDHYLNNLQAGMPDGTRGFMMTTPARY